MKCVSDFRVEDFNEFSDHAPVIMSFHMINRTKPKQCDCKSETANISKRNKYNKYKRNRYNLMTALSANLDMLNKIDMLNRTDS